MAQTSDPQSGQVAPASRHRARNANERVFLSLVQSEGAIASSEAARRAGLSAQTGSVLARALEAEGLVLKGEPLRGKVGKPVTPLSLNPDGVYSIGLRIGRRRADLVLLTFDGAVRRRLQAQYAYPTPGAICAFLDDGIAEFINALSPAQIDRIAGLGVAAPFEIWNWLDIVGAPQAEMEAWRDFDLARAFHGIAGVEVFIGNDGTLACGAEHAFGAGAGLSDFAYFMIGSFAGGGLVLNGELYAGRSGNAAAFGTLPVGGIGDPSRQLLKCASLFPLERALEANGQSAELVWREAADWSEIGPPLDAWIDEAARGLAVAAVSVAAVIDTEAAVIDGAMPPAIRARLVARVGEEIDRIDTQGIAPPRIIEGRIGRMAGAIGAAYQPILARYLMGGGALTPRLA